MSHPGIATIACANAGTAAVSCRGAATIVRPSILEALGGTWAHRMHQTLGRHESVLPWAQSATDGYIVELHPSDGTDISLFFAEQCVCSPPDRLRDILYMR